MGQSYDHLSLEDRCTIAKLQAEGRSIRQISAAVDRSPSTIGRELKRDPRPMFPNPPGLLRVEPYSQGLRERIWWGAATRRRDGPRSWA